MSNYTFKKVRKNCLEDLIPIFKDAFGGAPSLTSLRNKHETDFAGESEIGYIAYDEKEIPVGFYGVFPLKVSVNGSTHLIAQSGDTMVKKNHGRRGLFSKLAKSTYSLCQERGIKAVFAFASETSYPGFVRNLGLEHNENVNKYRFFVPTIPIALILRRIKFLKLFHNFWVTLLLRFVRSGEYFESSILEDNQDSIIHDKDFWNYKLKNNDIFLIKIFNSQAAIKVNEFIEVGDIKYKNKKDLIFVMITLHVLGLFMGINLIKFYCSPSCRIDRDMQTIRKPKVGLPIVFRNFDPNIDLSNLKFTYIDMDTF